MPAMPEEELSQLKLLKVQQNINGEQNQVVAENYGTVFRDVGTVNQYTQQLPRKKSLHQLRRDIVDFTGRESELKEILKYFTERDSGVLAIFGMGGVGKSALAMHVAHILKDSFSDVQLYVDLNGVDGKPKDSLDVLTQWLRDLGREDNSIPSDLPALETAVSSELQGKRTVLLLDNASDEKQVRPLLPGVQSCAVIITSRKSLGYLEGAQLLELDVMTSEDAYAFLSRKVGEARLQADTTATSQILKLCSYLPLAITIAGGTLRNKPRLELRDYAQRLNDEQQRFEQLQGGGLDVQSSIEVSYQELEETTASLFRWLGLLEGKDFGVEIAAILIDQGAAFAENELEKLESFQLIEAKEGKRYYFNDLVGLFAKEKLIEAETLRRQIAKQNKVINWYDERLSEISDVFSSSLISKRLYDFTGEIFTGEEHVPDISQTLGCLQWFDLEKEHLFVSVIWASQRCNWDKVMSLTLNLGPFITARSEFLQDFLNAYRYALQGARRNNQLIREAELLTLLGSIQVDLGDPGEAIGYIKDSHIISLTLNHYRGLASALSLLGYAQIRAGDLRNGMQNLRYSSTFSRGDKSMEALVNYWLGLSHYCLEEAEESIKYYKQSIFLFSELGNRLLQAHIAMALAQVYISQQEWSTAQNCCQQSLAFFRQLQDSRNEALVCLTLGNLLLNKNDLEKAIDYFLISLSISREVGMSSNAALVSMKLGDAYHRAKQSEESISFYEESLSLYQDIGAEEEIFSIYLELGHQYEKYQKFDKAIATLEKRLDFAFRINNQKEQSKSLYWMGWYQLKSRRVDESIACFKKGLTIAGESQEYYLQARNIIFLITVLLDEKDDTDEADPFVDQLLTLLPKLENSQRTAGLLEIFSFYVHSSDVQEKLMSIQRTLSARP